ncbi:MAG: (2Fe-2S)-binding protein, partial [Hyphomicrobiales bacterium]|nr:(2Fe-2S)-binding protein [Hyphomicrobiales bacterium]
MSDDERLFENYSKAPRRVPPAIWTIARLSALAATIALAALLVLRPGFGLALFWGAAIPALPALFALAPGLWRQICPMATLNQAPRRLGLSFARDLPRAAGEASYGIAVGAFTAAILLRAPLLNRDAHLVAVGVVGSLALALAGGLIFKGRSGWCGTFCPLGPIQRDYGQAPAVPVRNGHCPTCVGCQKSCYDFNPNAAAFADIEDPDRRWGGQRLFFAGMMPGLIVGYFAQAQAPAYGQFLRAGVTLAAAAASVGAMEALDRFTSVSRYRLYNSFAAAALVAFYAFAGPLPIAAVARTFGHLPAPSIAFASRWIGVAVAVAIMAMGRRNRRAYDGARRKEGSLALARPAAASAGRANSPIVTDRGTGASFPAIAGSSLLEALEAARIDMPFGCRSGLCGADAVLVIEGGEHLTPPGEDERATLRRLGLEGQARLACVCRATGPVTLERDLSKRAGPG